MKTLQNCGKLIVKESPIEGFGVFATEDIQKGTILEEVPFVTIPNWASFGKALYDFLSTSEWMGDKVKYTENLRKNLGFKDPEKYYFKWFPQHQLDKSQISYTVLPLGFGCIYNSSNTQNNAGWVIKDSLFIFKAEKDIQKDEEVKTFYGYFLSENGTIFNCDNVFNIGLDIINGTLKLKMFRFSSIEVFEASRVHPTYIRGQKMLADSKDGLSIKKISSSNSPTEDQQAVDVPEVATLQDVYTRLSECKNLPRTFSRIHIEYTNREGEIVKDVLVFKNS